MLPASAHLEVAVTLDLCAPTLTPGSHVRLPVDGSVRGARETALVTTGAAAAGPAGSGRVGNPSPGTPVRLTRRGRATRGAVTLVAGLVLLSGTLWGSNDHFPFGPFTMYATARRTDGYVRQTRVEAVDAAGGRFVVGFAAIGLRRAEIVGQIAGFRTEPERLESVAAAYAARRPEAPPIVRIDIVQSSHRLDDGQPTGEVTRDVVLSWPEDGAQ